MPAVTDPEKVISPVVSVKVIVVAAVALVTVVLLLFDTVKVPTAVMESRTISPVAPAFTVRSWLPPVMAPVVIFVPSLVVRLTAAVESVVAPKVSPSKPLKVKPSSCTAPARFVAVFPIAQGDIIIKADARCGSRRETAIPSEGALKTDQTRSRPLFTSSAAPVPLPRFVTAPDTVVVPTPTPAARSRFCGPVMVVTAILPPLESRVTAAVDRVRGSEGQTVETAEG